MCIKLSLMGCLSGCLQSRVTRQLLNDGPDVAATYCVNHRRMERVLKGTGGKKGSAGLGLLMWVRRPDSIKDPPVF
jgi:hypothetical protein